MFTTYLSNKMIGPRAQSPTPKRVDAPTKDNGVFGHFISSSKLIFDVVLSDDVLEAFIKVPIHPCFNFAV